MSTPKETTAASVKSLYCISETILFALDRSLAAPMDAEGLHTVMTGIRAIIGEQAVSLRDLHDFLNDEAMSPVPESGGEKHVLWSTGGRGIGLRPGEVICKK